MNTMDVAEELGKSHGLIAALQGVDGLLEEHNQFAQKHFEGDDLVRYQECYLDALEVHFHHEVQN